MKTFDVIVVGTGTMGMAACMYLAKSGVNVLGIDQFLPPHDLGSHSGATRIIRKSYFEHPDYVPLLEESYKLWNSLENESGNKIYHETGLVYYGLESGHVYQGVKESSRLYKIPVNELDIEEGQQILPLFTLGPSWSVLYEPHAGLLDVETAIHSFQKIGSEYQCRFIQEKVIHIEYQNQEVKVKTDHDEYTANKIICCAGSWTHQLLSKNPLPLSVTRQMIAWVKVKDPSDYENMPCWFIQDPGIGMLYGFPYWEKKKGIKVALHVPGEHTDPNHVKRNKITNDIEIVQYFITNYLPREADAEIEFQTCLYTNTPDEHFIIDAIPDTNQQILIACGFSGHGFKFAPVIGKIMSDMAIHQKSDLNTNFLSLQRFDKSWNIKANL